VADRADHWLLSDKNRDISMANASLLSTSYNTRLLPLQNVNTGGPIPEFPEKLLQLAEIDGRSCA
jgi:hypothetical protein